MEVWWRLGRKCFPPDIAIVCVKAVTGDLMMQSLEVDLVTILPEHHRCVGAIDDPPCLQLNHHQVIWSYDEHVTHPALSVATTPSPAMGPLRGLAAGKHPHLRHQRLSSAAIKPFLDSPAGSNFIPMMTPEEAVENEPVALVHHLRPEPRAVGG
jgi:hypothetical protein